jgi:hypothetical protein
MAHLGLCGAVEGVAEFDRHHRSAVLLMLGALLVAVGMPVVVVKGRQQRVKGDGRDRRHGAARGGGRRAALRRGGELRVHAGDLCIDVQQGGVSGHRVVTRMAVGGDFEKCRGGGCLGVVADRRLSTTRSHNARETLTHGRGVSSRRVRGGHHRGVCAGRVWVAGRGQAVFKGLHREDANIRE